MNRIISIPSISQLLIYHVQERLSAPEALEIFEKELHRPLLPVWSMIGAVRRKENIIQLVKRMARRQRFGIKHVERSATNALFLQSFDQCALIYQQSPPDVDEDRAWLHRGELRFADHALRFRCQRRNHHDVIRSREQLVFLVRAEYLPDVGIVA